MSKARPASQLLAASSLIVLASFTGGCSSLERIRNIGEQPALADIENPTTKPGYKPVHMPMPEPTPAIYNENSLWRSGSREFFKDQRAHQVGDILTITVNITDAAKRIPASPISSAPRPSRTRRPQSCRARF
jgi:flagellar L-ring protein FlgH